MGASYVLQKPVGREQLANALAAVGFHAAATGKRRTVLVIDDDPKAVKLLAALAMTGDREKMEAAGCDDYIANPVRYQELLKLVGQMV